MSETIQSIVLGGGCFWCIEAVFKRIDGIKATRPGYAGGHMDNPEYKKVCQGSTGHAEVVQIDFDSEIISLDAVLDIFWKAHDPTTLNRQGHDVGTQYRSIILYADETQKNAAEASLKKLQTLQIYPNPPVTEIIPLKKFWPAEEYHKDYFEDNRNQGYCRLVIEPKLKKLSLPN